MTDKKQKILLSFDINDISTFVNILKTFDKIVSETPWTFDKNDGLIIQCVADNKSSYATLSINKDNLSNYIYNHPKDKYHININFENLLNLLTFAIDSDKIIFTIYNKNNNILHIDVCKTDKITKIDKITKKLKLNLSIIDSIKSYNKSIPYDFRIDIFDSTKFNKYLKDMEKISPYISFSINDSFNEFVLECNGDTNSNVLLKYIENDDTDKLTFKTLSSSPSTFKNYYQISDITQYSNSSSSSKNISLFFSNNEILRINYIICNNIKKSKKDNKDDKDDNKNNEFANLQILITNIDPDNFKISYDTNSEYSNND